MNDSIDLSDTPEFWGGNGIKRLTHEAKEIYGDLSISILEPLKRTYKNFEKKDLLLREEILKRILISEEEFIDLYIFVYHRGD
jgi:hypothetical protein